MTHDITKCETIKECLLWADRQWPGFWKFITHQSMTTKEKYSLSKSVNGSSTLFPKMVRQLKFCAKIDHSEEARNLLSLGTNAMNSFNKQSKSQKTPNLQKYMRQSPPLFYDSKT